MLDLTSFNLLFVCFSYFIQNVLEDYDDIVVTVGSGGTASGIAAGNYLTGSKLKQGSSLNFFLSKWYIIFMYYWIGPWDKASPYITL